jgi:hypothetical protein
MKSFSKYISEVAQPRERGAEEEQAFKDQHTYEVIPHPVALDTQFTGDIQKPQAMRPADNKGDHTYDKAYAANVTGFEEFDESVESVDEGMLDELSPAKLGSYINKAHDDSSDFQNSAKRKKGIATATNKLVKKAGGKPAGSMFDESVDEGMMDNIKKKANDMRRNVIGLSQAEKDAAKKKQMAKQHASTMKNIGSAMGAVAKKDKAAEVARLKQGLKNVENQRKESVELEEDATHSDKHINMAIGIASDKRYKGGNMTGAVKAMNKMKPGISDHPKVAAVLKRQNEALSPKQKEIDHDKDGDIDGKDLAALRAKKKKPLAASYKEEADLEEGSIKGSGTDRKSVLKKAYRSGEQDTRQFNTPGGMSSNKPKRGSDATVKKAYQAGRDSEDGGSAYKGKRRSKPQDVLGYKKKSYNEELDETTQSALMKPVTTTGVDGKKRTVMKTAKPKITDDNGQDKIITNESILKELAENVKFKVGLMKLKDGKSVVLKKQDVDLLTQMFKDLSPNNRRKLGMVAMKDKSGFDEILGFAREAL